MQTKTSTYNETWMDSGGRHRRHRRRRLHEQQLHKQSQ